MSRVSGHGLRLRIGEQSCGIELGSARGGDGHRSEAEQAHPPPDVNLDNSGVPAAIDRTTTRRQHCAVGYCETVGFRRRTPRSPEGAERDGSCGEGRRIGCRGGLKTRRKRKPDVNHADGQDYHKAGDTK